MSLESALHAFSTQTFLTAGRDLFKDTLKISLNPVADAAVPPSALLRSYTLDFSVSSYDRRNVPCHKVHLVS